MRPLLELHDVFELVFDGVTGDRRGGGHGDQCDRSKKKRLHGFLVVEFTSEKHVGPTRVPQKPNNTET